MLAVQLALLVLLAGCSRDDGRAKPEEIWFVRLAEGYSSSDRETGIVAAQRMFSVPMFSSLCSSPAPASLVVDSPEPVRLVNGEWFRYDQLVVLALDSAGNTLPRVPIVVEIEEVNPELLDLDPITLADSEGRVMPVRTGTFHFRFRVICEPQLAQAVVRVEVVAR